MDNNIINDSKFVKSAYITYEIADFLEKPREINISRIEVVRCIHNYIRTNNLQDKENKHKINPDNKLSTLLNLKKTDELTYSNLINYLSYNHLTYMNNHIYMLHLKMNLEKRKTTI